MTNLATLDRNTRSGLLPRSVFDFFNWDPFRTFFDGFSGAFGVDVTRTDTGYQVELPVPGYKPNEIEVTVEDSVLTVTGKNERRSFTRSLVLPEEINADGIEAKVEHGMLTLTLPLHPKAQPKRIAIKA
jgi:HSP20 family protein